MNGKLLAVDPVPFTPFNSSIIRFKAKRPVTIAVKLVDWEENLGTGSESGRGSAFHPGDGGFVAHIKDVSDKTVVITDRTWRAQTFYISPIKDRNCLKVIGQKRDSLACDTNPATRANDVFAAHWPIPKNWMRARFNDSHWPMASTFSNRTVGVKNKPAFMNFRNIFDDPKSDAQFIWTSNLILDNVVLLRKVVR